MSDSEDERWMRLAIELAWQCPPSATAYSVGAVIVDADGDEISRGFSREGGDPMVHAEESALGKLAADDPRLAGGDHLQHARAVLAAEVPGAHVHPADHRGRACAGW